MTLGEIKAAIDAGQTVHWANTGYRVHKDSFGQYLITFEPNGSTIWLTDRSGQRLKGEETEFFVAGPECGDEKIQDSQLRPDVQGRAYPAGRRHSLSGASAELKVGKKGKRAFWLVIPQGVEKAIPDALARTSGTGQSKRNHPMFAGTLTRNVETAAAQYTGMIHGARFDIAIQLEARAKMSERSPDYDVTAVNKSGRKVRIGTAWNETGTTSGNPYISMQIDVGLGPFRVNAVQTKEARAAQSGAFEIIPLVSNGLMKSGSISGELTAMDADNAFTGYIANMMFDLEFMLIENSYKSEETHPDYRIEVSSPRGTPIRIGSAWMAKSSRTGNNYLSLLINTPDGDLRVNAVQNEEQRGGQTFSIIPFIDSGEQPQDAGAGLSLVA